jgi:ribonuclease Z
MTLNFQVLGDPGRDNALLVRVDAGQAYSRLLFDCGEDCLAPLSTGEVQGIDHLFFSHFHFDHVAGFDTFFRCNFNRPDRPNVLWGPPGAADVLQHRLRGYTWNLVADQTVSWRVHEIQPDCVATFRFDLAEGFATTHAEARRTRDFRLLDGPGYVVEALLLDHGIPSVGYVVREKPRVNVDPARLAALNLRPGPWLKRICEPRDESVTVEVEGTTHRLANLQDALLVTTSGESLAYLTDFRLDAAAEEWLARALHGCTAVVCESQYRDADRELAQRNFHVTSIQAANLARRADVGRLILFHVSDRYRREEWLDLLAEAQAVFPRTCFPSHWALGTPP